MLATEGTDVNAIINTTQQMQAFGADEQPFITRASAPTPASSLWPHFLTGQPERPTRVIVVDDDAHIRRVICQELLSDARVQLVGQAGSLREGLRLIGLHEFDVMLVDLSLGDGSGFGLIEHMKCVRPHAEAVVVSATEDETQALRAFELGATGYLVKHSWFDSFAQAVLQVVNGGAAITPNLARRLLKRLKGSAQDIPSPAATAPPRRVRSHGNRLSEREVQILQQVATGYTSREIGKCLGISAQTVNTHVKNIYRKLQVRSRAQAVNLAAMRGLLS